MTVGSIKENINIEKRVAITPETAKNIISLGLSISLEKDYGTHLGISDKQYEDSGAKFYSSALEVINNSKLLLKVNCPTQEEIKSLKEKTILVGIFNPTKNKDKFKEILKKNINIFSLELLPRISRAQSMDVLSSQSNLAGYRAVIESIYEFEKAIPMMMTAAGTVPAAKVLVIGAGVAGLQAIATAKRLGAIVSATDVRTTSKEQVESLGGKFLMVEQEENLETTGGYAKEASEEFKKKQADLLKNAMTKNDIVICTALIPGRPAPRILNEELVKLLKQGGNAAHSEVDKINVVNGVKIIGIKNLMNKLPLTASSLYAKNLFSFVRNLYSKEKQNYNINLEDEIITKTMIKD